MKRILYKDLAQIRRKNRNLRWTMLSIILAFVGWLLGMMIRAHT